DLPLATRLLLIFSELLIEYWYIFTIGFIAIILMLNKASNTYKGKKIFDQLKLKIPFVNISIVKIITSRFTRTLASLLNSGIPIISALETSANVTNNIVVIEGIQMVLSDIRKGVSLATLLNRMDIFPPMVISMVSIGEETGALDEMLAKTADFYDDELEVAIERMVSMLEPFMIVVMSIIIGFIVIAMLLPMFDIMQVI
ncbi:MAG: type II secretion system F family protein, partial [Clostridiales bacterium]|nr:type II secretion system F family protein [Clostridiales bacterium]